MKAEKQAGMIVLFLFVLLAIFLIIVFFKTKAPGYDYNGFDVQEIDLGNTTVYRTTMYINNAAEPRFLNSRYGPREIESFEADEFRKDILDKKKLYATVDPDQNLTGKTMIALFEINNLIELFYGIGVDGALTHNANNYTEKSCTDVNSEEGVIWLKLDNENKITNENGCIIIKGVTEEDLIKGADRLIFGLLKVIK